MGAETRPMAESRARIGRKKEEAKAIVELDLYSSGLAWVDL